MHGYNNNKFINIRIFKNYYVIQKWNGNDKLNKNGKLNKNRFFKVKFIINIKVCGHIV